MQNLQKDSKGFSLVEVMVAMVLLALISIPLMNNFATSAKLNTSSRQIQDANTIGQRVMEQVKSASIADTYQKYNVIGNDNFKVINNAGVIVNGTEYVENQGKYTFQEKAIQGDMGSYNVEVTVDPSPFDSRVNDMGNVVSGPNRVGVPNLLQIHGDNNVVFCDNGTTYDIAYGELQPIHATACARNSLYSEKKDEEFKKFLDRDMILYIGDEGQSLEEEVSVKLEYVYYANKDQAANQPYGLSIHNKSTPIPIGDFDMEEINSIYIFYHAFADGRGDNLKIVNNVPQGKLQNIQLYVVAQGSSPGGTYQLNFMKYGEESLGPTIPESIKDVFLNVPPNAPNNDDSLKIRNELVSSTEKKRLNEVTVKVYKGNAATPYDASDLLAEFRSTKGE